MDHIVRLNAQIAQYMHISPTQWHFLLTESGAKLAAAVEKEG
jgi:hypothetical protein